MTLTREDVIAAGAQLLDSEGIEGISMRKLAKSLGTGPATLYWHVHDKDELLALILDDTMSHIEVPGDGEWDERLIAILDHARRALLPRPMLVSVVWSAGWRVGPETLRVADAVLGCVAESGLPEDQVADAYFGLITFLLGFILAETSTAGNPEFGSDDAVEEPDGDAQAALEERFPNLARFGPGADLAGMQRRFEYGISDFIDGIKARTASPKKKARAKKGS